MRIVLIAISLAFVMLSCDNPKQKKWQSDNFELVKLGEGIYGCIHKFGGKAICNVGIVDNGEETIVFDSFLSPDVASELLSAVERLDLSPIKYVVNSHFHNDHIRGNQVFSEDVHIISTKKTRDLIEEWEPLQIEYEKENAPARLALYDSLYRSFKGDKQSREYQQILMWKPYYEILVNSHKEVKTRLPDMFVDSVHQFDGSARRVVLLSNGIGHSESDLVMHLPDDGVLFTGDLVFNSRHPYVPDGDIDRWKNWLDFMNSLNVKKVLPGHGPTGSKELISAMKQYLLDLEASAKALVVNKRSIDDPESTLVPEQYREWWFDRFYEYNLRYTYSKLQEAE